MKSLIPRAASRHLGVVLISILAVFALLTLTEVVLNVLALPQIRLQPPDQRHGYRSDPDLGWIGHANSFGYMSASRLFHLRLNSLGLRDIEPLPTTGRTILFLGDSLVWGIDVEAEERFTEQLRADLPGFRIVNAGIAGYGTDQEYLLLQRLWPRVEPSVVVLIFSVGSDRLDNSANYRYFSFKPYLTNIEGRWRIRGQPVPLSPQVYFYDSWLALHSAVFRLALVGYSSIFNRKISVPDPTEPLVGMMRDFVTGRGAKFVVGLSDHEPALERFLDAEKITYARLDEAETFPTWGNHWTPSGHALVAQRLMTLLSKEGVESAAPATR